MKGATMGYTTDFKGRFDLDKPLTPEHAAYLTKFSETRRMKRDAAKAEALPDPVRLAAELPIGDEGAYFVGAPGFMGQHEDDSVLDGNLPPGQGRDGYSRTKPAGCQPGLWCQWIPTEDGRGIEWNQGEKFYEYVEWLKYLIAHFLKPWGYVLSGRVTWQGEEHGDHGTIIVENNEVRTE
jgi:hypothetical protein